jgi:hypothetical protein
MSHPKEHAEPRPDQASDPQRNEEQYGHHQRICKVHADPTVHDETSPPFFLHDRFFFYELLYSKERVLTHPR